MISEQDINLFGDKKVFSKRLSEGYTEIAFGHGQWDNNLKKISSIFAFYKPEGNISTYEYPKSINLPDPFPCRGQPFQKKYSKEEFEKYLKLKKINLSEKSNLVNIVNKFEN